MALPADWVDFGGGQIYRQTQDGFAPVSQDELDAYQYQTQNQGRDPQAQADYEYTQKAMGDYLQGDTSGARMLTPQEMAAYSAGNFTPPAGMNIYNAGNGALALTPVGDPRFIAAPKNTGLGGFETALGHPSNVREMHQGLSIMALPFAAAGLAAAGAAGAGGDAALTAGGGEVGSGYAASAPGWGAGATEATGTVAGTSGAESLTGTTANDSLASNTVLDDYGNPMDMGGTGGTGSNAADPYNLGVDQYGNPTGQYADSTFKGGQPDLTNYGDTSPSMLQQAKDLAKQAGITPQSALNYLKQAIGRGAPAVLGAVAANRQADSLADLAKQYMDLGAPSRARYESSFDPNFTMANDAGYTDALNQTSKASMHALSVNGNPAGSPNAWGRTMQDVYEKTAYPALQNFRNTNANAGGIASLQTAAPGAATGAITAQGNVFNAVGAGANDIFNPKPSLAETLAQYKRLMSAP